MNSPVRPSWFPLSPSVVFLYSAIITLVIKGQMIKIENNRQIPSLPAQSWVKTFSSSGFISPSLHFNTFIPLYPENYFGLRQLLFIHSRG